MSVPANAGLSPAVIACLGITWVVWGSTYLAIKIALVSFPPLFQMGSRFLVAGAGLWLWMWRVRRIRVPNAIEWRNSLLIGALLLGAGAGATAYAEQTVASGLIATFIAVEPALMAVGGLLFGYRLTRRQVIAIAVGSAGVLLLVRGSGFSASPVGLVAMTIATVGWSAGSLLGKDVFKSAPGLMGFASQLICGGVLLLALSAVRHEWPQWPPTHAASLAWLYLVTFGSLLAFSAFLHLMASAPMPVAMSYTYVNPVIAMWLGAALGGEHISTAEWLATAIIIGSVALMLRGQPPERSY